MIKKIQQIGNTSGSTLLLPSDIKGNPTITIVGNIEQKITRFSKGADDMKVFADVRLADETIRTWIMNRKTSNYLIDLLGEDEENWTGKKVDLELVRMSTPNGLKDVIFAKGAA